MNFLVYKKKRAKESSEFHDLCCLFPINVIVGLGKLHGVFMFCWAVVAKILI